MKKEIIYTMPNETAEQRADIQNLRQELYGQFNNVSIYPDGAYHSRIVASEEKSTEIEITIEGGVLRDVRNLPHGYTYKLIDNDDLTA